MRDRACPEPRRRVPAGRISWQLAAGVTAFALVTATPAAQQSLEQTQAESLCAAGEAEYERAQYAAARERGLRCAEIYDRLASQSGIGRANHLLSMIASLSGDFAEAEARARRAVSAYEAANDTRGRAVATLELVRVAKLDRGEDLRLLERVIADARTAGDRLVEARALHSQGDHLFTAAAYEDALESLNQASAIFEDVGDRRALGRVYNSVGRLYRAHGRSDEALKFQQKALAIHEAVNSPFELMQSLNAVAVTYQSLGDSRSARRYFERALAIAERASSPRIQDFLRANLAGMMVDQGAHAEAARVLEGVLARGFDAFPGMRMRELSRVYVKLGRRDEAMTLAERAVDLCTGRDLDCLYSLDQRAAVHAASGRTSAALDDIDAALDTIEDIRAKLVPADFFKQQFNVAREAIYSRAIALQLRDGREAEALTTAELARSRAFVDLLASKDLQPRESLPLVVRGSTADLPSQVAAPAATADDLVDTAKRLHSTLLVYWTTDDRLFIWVIAPDGRMHSSQVDVRASRLAELIRATSPFTENGTPDSGRPGGRAPRTLTTRGAASIALNSNASSAWRELYGLIVKPVRRALPRQPGALITIVPHGPLSALAFAALQSDRGRYLLEDYTLHYVPAGAVLQFTAPRRHPDSRTGSVLLVSDPVPPVLSKLESPLPRLAGARAEARAIARLIPSARVTSLEGESATKETIRAAAPGKSVLHFATHAIVHDEDPFGSFLAVTPAMVTTATTLTTGSAASDGLLTAREIYGLSLDADLVVLSACRSAGGRVSGDGIATFARAFIYAGTPSLVASLWDVADQPANRLLPDFYRAWLGGATKARALRTAQLRLLGDLRANKLHVDTPLGKILLPEHPVFWAGFALFGEPD